MRVWIVREIPFSLMMVMLLMGVLGCERELPYQTQSEKPVDGYQLEGYVTDHLGVPLKGVPVALWYDYEFVDAVRVPTPEFLVDDTTKLARVQVLNRNKTVVAVLFQGRAPAGPLDYTWDRRDVFGAPARSGVYTVDFSLNGVSRASYSVVIDGAITSVTDSLGHYIIPNENLPVGFYPVPRFSSPGNQFLGNFRVTTSVALELYLEIHRAASLTLTKDQVTRRDFTI
jgi:hypothetical protein